MSSNLLLLVGSVTVISFFYLDEGFDNVLGKLCNILAFSEQNKSREDNDLRSGGSSTSKPVDNFSAIRIGESFLQQRKLATGDFSTLNDLIRPTTIELEDFESTNTFRMGSGFFSFETKAKVTVTDIECKDLYLGDLNINYEIQDNQTLLYNIDVPEFRFECDMSYRWSFSFIGGSGKLDVESGKSSGSTDIMIGSDDSSKRMLPHGFRSDDCSSDVRIEKLEFSGSVDSIILNWFEDVIEVELIDSVNIIVCDELATIGEGLADVLFVLIDETVSPHLEPIEEWRLDPLHSENQLQLSNDIQLVNFNDISGSGAVKLFVDSLNLMNNHFESTDPNDSNMGINTIIRDYVLDDDNAHVIDIANLPFDFNPELFDTEDGFTESRATLQKIRFLGLDSLTSFVPSTAVGNHTFQADVGWKKFTVEIFLEVELKTATGSDSMIQSDSTDGLSLVENVKLVFNLDNLEAKISLLVAADANAIEGINLGSLLTFEDMISCVLSIFHELSMSGFTASVGDIQQPSLTGFESIGLEHIAETIIAGAFDMYKDSILLAIPSYFETTIRDSITDQLAQLISNAVCPVPDVTDGEEFVDFRDLLLQPEDSLLMNGTGDGRYGESAVFLLDLVRNSTIADADGLSQLNSNVILPMINFNSPGEGGDILFNSEPSTITINDQVELEASDLRIQNLDTVMAPVNILQPSANPYSISNGIAFGPVAGRPFIVSTLLFFNITEGGFFLHTESEVDMSVSADSFEMSSVLFAMLNTTTFKQFPVGDAFNVHCWLNAFHELYIDTASLKSANFTVSLRCRNCTGPGAQLFLDLDDSSGMGLGSMINGTELINMFAAALVSDEFKNFTNGLLIAAPELCPHSERYNNDTVTEYNNVQDILQAMLQNMIIKPFEDFFTLFTAF